MRIILVTSTALFLVFSMAAASTEELAFSPAPITGVLNDVDLSDGVDESEAKIIANAYFNKHVGCGIYTGISDSPEAWVVEGKFGYAGEPIRGFFINKRTGTITSPIGPSYLRPSDMLLLGPNNSFKPIPHQGGA